MCSPAHPYPHLQEGKLLQNVQMAQRIIEHSLVASGKKALASSLKIYKNIECINMRTILFVYLFHKI